MADPEAPGFEGSLAQLEARVRSLEAGELSLEDSLRLFEEGVALAQTCHEQLEAAEARVTELVRGAQGIEERPVQDVE